MENNKIRKSSKITLGATVAMTTAIMMTGCSDASSTGDTYNSDNNETAKEARMFDNVKADYIEICKNIETNARLSQDNCLESSSQVAKWLSLIHI